MNGQCTGGGPQCNPPCPVGQMCILGALCLPIPCNPACPKGQVCDKGACVPSCGIGLLTPCPPPKTCIGGKWGRINDAATEAIYGRLVQWLTPQDAGNLRALIEVADMAHFDKLV